MSLFSRTQKVAKEVGHSIKVIPAVLYVFGASIVHLDPLLFAFLIAGLTFEQAERFNAAIHDKEPPRNGGRIF
jgi:hypothetical protein